MSHYLSAVLKQGIFMIKQQIEELRQLLRHHEYRYHVLDNPANSGQ